ncbi:MFS transporter [Micromonospora siamensis]|uniref:Major Facilitator Superfamily protein n=1 Tax=Micromonospora siamensis TaxID=299152 RepID=A0A1C5I9C9_9ACTN|nr:MFS transporter [Micromonospora siamensis]SCG54733.1 Major Facilitator Superfamily protein [Micromonospora siamensis]
MRVFNLIWAGQATSLIGSAMTAFGVGVWIFARTGSPTAFATLILAASLPGLLALPVAGVVVDRFDRRRVMLLSDLGTATGPLVLLILHTAGALQLWHLYVMAAVSSVFKAFQWPAFSSLVPQLVAKDKLSQANGRVGMAEAVGMVFGDLLGGALYAVLGLRGLLLVDLVTFAVAATTMLLSYRLRPAIPPVRVEGAPRLPMRSEMTQGWHFIRQRRGLLGLLLFFAGYNLMMEMALVLLAPLVLSSHPPSALGVINAVGAVGMIAVSGVLSFTRQPRRLVRALLLVAVLHSCLLLGIGASHGTPWLLAVGMFGVLGGYAVTNAVTPTIWQRKTPTEVQGRVFAIRRLLAWSSGPIAFAAAGPLTEYVGTPLADGPLAGSVGRLTGSGTGGGIAMVFLLCGVLLLGVVAVTCLPRAVRRLEQDLPDAEVAQEPTPVGAAAPS